MKYHSFYRIWDAAFAAKDKNVIVKISAIEGFVDILSRNRDDSKGSGSSCWIFIGGKQVDAKGIVRDSLTIQNHNPLLTIRPAEGELIIAKLLSVKTTEKTTSKTTEKASEKTTSKKAGKKTVKATN